MGYFRQNSAMLIGCAVGAAMYGAIGAALGGSVGVFLDRFRRKHLAAAEPIAGPTIGQLIRNNIVLRPVWRTLQLSWTLLFFYALSLVGRGESGAGPFRSGVAAFNALVDFVAAGSRSRFHPVTQTFDASSASLRGWTEATHGIVDLLTGFIPALSLGRERLLALGYDVGHSPLLNLIAVSWVLTLGFVFMTALVLWFSSPLFRDGSWSEGLALHSVQESFLFLLGGTAFTVIGAGICFFGWGVGKNFGHYPIVDDVFGISIMTVDFMVLALGLYGIIAGGLTAAAKLQTYRRRDP